MTASRIPPEQASFTSPIIDYEPPPVGVTQCPPPTPAALHRRTPRPLRPVASRAVRDPLPPQAVIVFADAALRRVLEVIDRRRPFVQLRPLVAPVLIDPVVALARTTHSATATLRRVRLRMVDDETAEVFASYTRGPRVRAIAARVERYRDGWRIVALQIG
jgi:hypothetical protein